MENKIKIPYMSHKQNSAADPNPICITKIRIFLLLKKINRNKQSL